GMVPATTRITAFAPAACAAANVLRSGACLPAAWQVMQLASMSGLMSCVYVAGRAELPEPLAAPEPEPLAEPEPEPSSEPEPSDPGPEADPEPEALPPRSPPPAALPLPDGCCGKPGFWQTALI